jgi:hypothetical protein
VIHFKLKWESVMDSKKKMVSAAISGLVVGTFCLSGCTTPSDGGSATMAEAKGECHGMNSCKGTGACGGQGHSCAGKNSCKGQGWLELSKSDCQAKGGTYKNKM